MFLNVLSINLQVCPRIFILKAFYPPSHSPIKVCRICFMWQSMFISMPQVFPAHLILKKRQQGTFFHWFIEFFPLLREGERKERERDGVASTV